MSILINEEADSLVDHTITGHLKLSGIVFYLLVYFIVTFGFILLVLGSVHNTSSFWEIFFNASPVVGILFIGPLIWIIWYSNMVEKNLKTKRVTIIRTCLAVNLAISCLFPIYGLFDFFFGNEDSGLVVVVLILMLASGLNLLRDVIRSSKKRT